MHASSSGSVRTILSGLTIGLVALAMGCGGSDDGSAADDAGSTAREVADKTGDAMRDAAEKTGDAMHDAAERTGEAVRDAADEAGEAVHDAAAEAGDAMRDAADEAGDALEGATGAMMKTDDAEMPADAVTLVGTTGCGHCSFGIGKACAAAMKTADGTIYVLDGVDAESDLFQHRMDGKSLTVVGVVTEGDPEHVDVKSYRIM